ncbi:MAG TPA: HEAT repeat domain-containing protein [Gemmatimonadales bacterium]|nr:HEAT repeat domain-containing protein [Gemmatimonadales bacterium]
MNNRASYVMRRACVLLALAAPASTASAQSLSQRIAKAPDGIVHLTYAARDGVCGNGAGTISFDCSDGTCGRRRITTNSDWDDDTPCPCDSGPVRLALDVLDGKVIKLRTYVGGHWKPATARVTDLGTVGAREAANFLLELARNGSGRAAEEAIFPATLADSVTIWPDLITLARSNSSPTHVRNQAVFWLSQAAGEAAVKDLKDLVDDNSVDREVREHAVFAISQEPRDVGVPALIQIARSNKDPEVRRKAIFWLGQSNDPRAISLFEEILTKP